MKNRIQKLIGILTVLVIIPLNSSFAQEVLTSYNQDEELGKVHWYRDYDQAVRIAEKEKKDIVILFQEVPGCATCRNYGHNVLSNPLMVEALENSFVPLAIFNNKGGKDKKVLEKFNEPSWNNPVIRIVDIKGNNLIKKIGNDYSAITLCKRLKEVLTNRKTTIPEYLNILELELESLKSNHIREDYFKMHCFWTGEKKLGSLNGVLSTESGFMNHSEVVKVKFNTSLLDQSSLINYAQEQGFEQITSSKNFRSAINDVHYYYLHSDYRYIPLSELQKTKINSAIGNSQSAEKYLSPQQKNWLYLVKNDVSKKQTSLHDKKIEVAWTMMLKNTKSNKK